jgi:methionine synthase II (cobalamin-independent)
VFATLGGSMPIQSASSALDPDALVRAAIAAQEEAGLEAISDGGVRHADAARAIAAGLRGVEVVDGHLRMAALPAWDGPILVEGWSFAAGCTDRAVKQTVVGPYSLGRTVHAGRFDRRRLTLALAEALNAELKALADAGCPLLEVVEDAATTIGDSPDARRLFVEAQRRLLAGLDGDGGPHRTLAVRGGNDDTAGAETILDAPYQSFMFDLCAGPDNWRLAVKVPGDRGVIVGAADARAARVDELEVLAFAIGYAASTGGRGHDRVGLATSGDMAGLDYDAAIAKIGRIGEAAALYQAPAGTLARAMDPRAIDIRSAAVGRYAPAPYDPASPRRVREGEPAPETPSEPGWGPEPATAPVTSPEGDSGEPASS